VRRVRGGPERAPGGWLGSAVVVGLALGLVWALKEFNRSAGIEDLRWLLAPTVRLVELSTGSSFELETHHGYLSRSLRYEIVPACAGVNFLAAAFCSLWLGFAHLRTDLCGRAVLLASSALAAYATTVLANATRLTIAIRLHDAGTSFGVLTPERLHCGVGVAVYFLFLAGLFALADLSLGGRRELAG